MFRDFAYRHIQCHRGVENPGSVQVTFESVAPAELAVLHQIIER